MDIYATQCLTKLRSLSIVGSDNLKDTNSVDDTVTSVLFVHQS